MALFLSLLEIELRHSTSLRSLMLLQNPTQHKLVKDLKLRQYHPYSTATLMLFGTLGIPDPYAFWYGKPRPAKLKKRCCC